MADPDFSQAAEQQQMCIAPPPVSMSSEAGAQSSPSSPPAGDVMNPILASVMGSQLQLASATGMVSGGAAVEGGSEGKKEEEHMSVGEMLEQAHDKYSYKELASGGWENRSKTVTETFKEGKNELNELRELKDVSKGAGEGAEAAGAGAKTMLEDSAKFARGAQGASGALGGLLGLADIWAGYQDIKNAKHDEDRVIGGAEVAGGIAGTAGGAVTALTALGAGGSTLSSIGAAANPVGLVLGAGVAGAKLGQYGDEQTAKLGWYGQRAGSVDQNGNAINRSATDAAADRAVADNQSVTYDESGKKHVSYDPTLGGMAESALLSMAQAPVVIAAGLTGIAKGAWDIGTHLFGGKTDEDRAREAAEGKVMHQERIADYRKASPEERKQLDQQEAMVNHVFGDDDPSTTKQEAQAQDRVEDAQTGATMLSTGGSLMQSAMRLPEGEGRDALIAAAQAQQQAGLAKVQASASVGAEDAPAPAETAQAGEQSQ